MLENPNHAQVTSLQTRQQKIPDWNTLQNPVRGRAKRNQNTRGLGAGTRGGTDCRNGICAGSNILAKEIRPKPNEKAKPINPVVMRNLG